MNLVIQRDGNAYFGRDRINLQDFAALDRRSGAERRREKDLPKGRSTPNFRDVTRALEFIQLAKITDITLITENSNR